MLVAAVEGSNIGVMANIGSGQRISEQGLLEGGEMIVMDSDRCLRCLSLNLTLKFATISSSLSSSQMMGSTTSSTPVSGSVLADDRSTLVSGLVLAIEKDEDAEEAEVEGEGNADGRVSAL